MESLGDVLKEGPVPKTTTKASSATSSAARLARPRADRECPICGGAGLVHPLKAGGKPDFGRVVACRCVRESLQRQKRSALERLSNLGVLSGRTFDKLSPLGRRGDAASQQLFSKAHEAARSFATDPKGWLVFLGPAGSGKTHLAAAIANYRLGLGQPVFYIGVSDLLDHLRSAASPGAETTYDELFEQVKNAPLLVLDDLSLETATAWAKEKLEQLLNHRFNAQLPTIITTDVLLDRLDDRLRARLADGGFCRVFTLEERSATVLEQLDSMGLELLKNMTFSNFDSKRANLPLEQRQNLEHAYELAFNYARNPQGWLVFQGQSGCGKTHLAAAIANYQKQAGKPAIFVNVADLLDHLRAAFNPDSRISYDDLFEKVKTAPLLIIDGFEGQSTTTWAQEKLYQLLNYRYNAQVPTVITTRLPLEEMDERISSRLVDPRFNTVFPIVAPNYLSDLRPRRESPPPQRPRPPSRSRGS